MTLRVSKLPRWAAENKLITEMIPVVSTKAESTTSGMEKADSFRMERNADICSKLRTSAIRTILDDATGRVEADIQARSSLSYTDAVRSDKRSAALPHFAPW